nr:hypothetical protein [Micavibrio sp.]
MTEDTEIIQKVKDYRYYDNVVGLYSSTSDVSNWKREIRQELRLLENGGYVEYDYDEEIDLYIIEQAKSLIDDLPILVLS